MNGECSGRKTLRHMAARTSEISTVSSTDTMAILKALLTTIPQELASGNIVELGDFGNFWLKSDSEGQIPLSWMRLQQYEPPQ